MTDKVRVVVEKVEGVCAANYSPGSEFILEKFLIKTEIPLCIHALSALQNFIYSLTHGAKPEDFGVEKLFVSCPDPGEPYGKGRVIFRVEVVE